MRIFQNALPASWVVNKQPSDYAKDYFVEIVEGEQLTGKTFVVQLKGEEALKTSRAGAHVSFYLKKKYAVYYADKVRLPVFLVIVDVNKVVGHWVFVQPYLLDELGGKDWRKKGSVAIKLPVTNRLSDIDNLKAAIDPAIEYMAALHPASIKSAIRGRQLCLERLDPRFGIKIDVIDDHEQITVVPKKKVTVTFQFKGKAETLHPKLDSLIQRGLPTKFEPEEIEVTGSPLFSEAFKAGGLLHWTQGYEASLSLVAKDASDKDIARIDGIRANLEGGLAERRLDGCLTGSPLKLHVTLCREGGEAPVRFHFDVKQWHGKPILHLPFFDQIAAFFQEISTAVAVDVKCYIQGNEFATGRIVQDELGLFKSVVVFLAVLTKVRAIARSLKVNPLLPVTLDREQVLEIEELYLLQTMGEFRRKTPGATVAISLPRPGVLKLLKMPNIQDAPLILAGQEPYKTTFLGQELEIGKLESTFTHTALASTLRGLQSRLKSNTKFVKVTFNCGQESEQIVRRVPTAIGQSH
jgi:hypothetical protein